MKKKPSPKTSPVIFTDNNFVGFATLLKSKITGDEFIVLAPTSDALVKVLIFNLGLKPKIFLHSRFKTAKLIGISPSLVPSTKPVS